VPPAPVLPDFDGPCLTTLGVALGDVLGGRAQPEWLPESLAGRRQLVLLVLDGLGAEQLAERRSLAPTLAGSTMATLTSVAPSTTAAALTSLATGLPPAAHGILGYRVAAGGGVLNVLTWRVDGADVRQRLPAPRLQPFAAFPALPGPVPVVSRAEYAPTGFSAAHLGRLDLHGWHTPSGLVVGVRRLLAAGRPFVYAYYDGLDRVAHATGLGEHYEAELRAADRLVGDVAGVLPPGAALVVTADHGQVEVGASVEVLGDEIMSKLTLISGEGRFRWLHARAGAVDDVAEAARAAFGHLAWVRTRAEIIEEGWLGGEPVPEVADRLGDVALVPFEPTAFMDPADTGELRLVARHGSLTEAEMRVPLAVIGAGAP
jgi:predicted AlkP superfamily pyrophosphatase or phosphodiesterase